MGRATAHCMISSAQSPSQNTRIPDRTDMTKTGSACVKNGTDAISAINKRSTVAGTVNLVAGDRPDYRAECPLLSSDVDNALRRSNGTDAISDRQLCRITSWRTRRQSSKTIILDRSAPCLLVYITRFPTYRFFHFSLLTPSRTYLFLRIDPLRFRHGCRKKTLLLPDAYLIFCNG